MDQKAYDAAMIDLKNSELARLAGIIDHDMLVRFFSIDDEASTRVNVTALGMTDEEIIAQLNGEASPKK